MSELKKVFNTKKGFDNLRIRNLSLDNFQVNEKIEELDLSSLDLSAEDLEIAKKIKKSFEKIKQKKQLLDDDLSLQDFELFELSKMEKKDYIRYLVYRYKYKILPKLHKISEYPACVQIEPTSVCNFRCIMCYQSDKTFSQKKYGFMGSMNLDLYKKIIDEIEGKVESLTFASRGEPTLYKALPKFLNYANGKFLAMKINTNASVLNEKLINDILSSDLQTLVFSVDSPDPEQYEKIRVKANFKKLMKNLKLFRQIKEKNYDKSKLIVRISGVKMFENQKTSYMEKQFGEFADMVGFTLMTPWQSTYENEITDKKTPCKEFWTRILIRYDGTVNPCDYDYKDKLSKFNVKNDTIKDIWNGEFYNNYRNLHLGKKRSQLYPCDRCPA